MPEDVVQRRGFGFMPELVVPDDLDEIDSAEIIELFTAGPLTPEQ